ncbi:IS701 family transposase [Streptomyces platensis]|uniref:IS701 family transposase n=1 Tax=Streptomyces platensis TaxID=58346 RepID=UPI001F22B548|nr:transposase [Streptomyces platensis]
MLGLLSYLPRKNCWTIAEWAEETTPHGMQHLLGRAKWDADQVRDDVRGYVVEDLHDDQSVLVVDETGDVKKGTHTVGVQRQYTGTAGRIEMPRSPSTWSTPVGGGRAAVDRELYVPRSWTADPDRCRAAGLGEDTAFATKPELGAKGHRFCDWVTLAMLEQVLGVRLRGPAPSGRREARLRAPADLFSGRVKHMDRRESRRKTLERMHGDEAAVGGSPVRGGAVRWVWHTTAAWTSCSRSRWRALRTPRR